MESIEKTISIESVRQNQIRNTVGSLAPLTHSIEKSGLRRPITVWRDGTLISGHRRLRAHLMMGRDSIPAVFVSTVEEAAKRLHGDILDAELDQSGFLMNWTEVCRLWQLLRKLDEPAAVRRADENRRRGVALRRQTQAGKRPAGRSRGRSEDYVLGLICEPFGISSATASRVEAIYRTATGPDSEKRELARQLMRDLDAGSPVWPAHQRLIGERIAPPTAPRPAAPADPAPAARQLTAWSRSMPQLEGLIAGLIELGPPNPELTWEQVGPVRTRLMACRRELEKMINQMKEINKS